MYKTGDLARWLDDGNIEYMGRIDTQVKIRGFRIETGEIESRLEKHLEVKDSAVVAQGDNGHKRLIAYYVAKDDAIRVSNDDFRSWLEQSLPEYMLPAAFVRLEVIPLMPNGKVDRRKLEQMDISLESGQVYVAPRNKLEEKLVAIWSEILQLAPEKIGVNDDFFSLGGHSLLAVLLVSKLKREVGISLPLQALFNLKTISGTAGFIETAQNQLEEPLEEAIDEDEFVAGAL
ncbi:phosphopantetheine-binding protein [Microbulbifer taiwanensis]